MNKKPQLLAVLLIFIGILSRILPHAPNFTPVGAVSVFSGAKLPKKIAFILPVLIMALSDVVIGFHSLIGYTWGAMLLISAISFQLLSKKQNVFRVVSVSILGSVLFFIVTNFGVWLEGLMYPLTMNGLVHCYINALPFFRNTLVSDLFYNGVFFGSFSLIIELQKHFSIVTTEN